MPEYNSVFTADRIKHLLKESKISVSKMLTDCDMNKNALYTMQSSGYLPRAETLARIADYLDCSVDYLLGRTDDPLAHKRRPVEEESGHEGETVIPSVKRE